MHGVNDCVDTNDNLLNTSSGRQYPTRTFYRKDLNLGQIKSLLVRPLKQSMAVFKRDAGAGRHKSETANQSHKMCKNRHENEFAKTGNQSVSI